jgi:hypothetical protein
VPEAEDKASVYRQPAIRTGEMRANGSDRERVIDLDKRLEAGIEFVGALNSNLLELINLLLQRFNTLFVSILLNRQERLYRIGRVQGALDDRTLGSAMMLDISGDETNRIPWYGQMSA